MKLPMSKLNAEILTGLFSKLQDSAYFVFGILFNLIGSDHTLGAQRKPG